MYFRSYICLTEHILDLRILYLYYRTYTGISDLIHVLQSIYLTYGSSRLRSLYLSYVSIRLRSLYLFYGTSNYTKVPVGTISRNRSESYHLQGQIKLMQIRTLVRNKYRSHQIHIPGVHRFKTYPKQTELLVYIIIIFRLIQFLMLITGLCLFGSPVGVTEHILMQNLCF